MGTITLTVWVAQKVKVSESLLRVSSFEGGSSGSEAVDSATIEPYQYVAIQVAALTLQADPQTKNQQVPRGYSTLNG